VAFKRFAGYVAAVTGAGSGIGALAIELARSGGKLAISDVDTDGLTITESD
jgi:NAD(P)-dependent dehydrogenase (short-subunit alcohol dehydrogenase family)